ncbi:hypothetical protein BDZ91DRAFT_144886 [Kalaharituber pfeilii]|nr:hypothetical protein BDZ91DRAFT_144886 [Kalaharituber pfeilii]
MSAVAVDISSPVHAYHAVHRKLLSLRRRKPSPAAAFFQDEIEPSVERSSKRKKGFASPEVIQRLQHKDRVRSVSSGVTSSGIILVGDDGGMAVFVKSTQPTASESLTSFLESLPPAAKFSIDGHQIPSTPPTPAEQEHEPEIAQEQTPLLEATPSVTASSSSPRSSESAVEVEHVSDAKSIEGVEQDHDHSVVFCDIDFEGSPPQSLDPAVFNSSSHSGESPSTVPLVGAATANSNNSVEAQLQSPVAVDTESERRPSSIIAQWQEPGSVSDQQDDKDSDGVSPLSQSPSSSKDSLPEIAPRQPGMPSANVEIYNNPTTPAEMNVNMFQPIAASASPTTRLETSTVVDEEVHGTGIPPTTGQDRQEERTATPSCVGSKIPVVNSKLPTPSANKNTYGNLTASQRRNSFSSAPPNSGTKPGGSPKISRIPTGLPATSLAVTKTRVNTRSTPTQPMKILTRDEPASAGPSTPPKPTVAVAKTSPRPRSNSKIPAPTTPKAGDEKKLSDILAFGDSFLSDTVDRDGDNEKIWARRREDLMGPLDVTPETRLTGAAGFAMGARKVMKIRSLVGNTMSLNDAMMR